MEDLPLVGDQGKQLSPGDFAARIEQGRLLVPAALLAVVRGLGVSTAVQLMTYLTASSSVVANLLSWDKADLDRARDELAQSLRGRIDESAFSSKRRRRASGALPGRSEQRGPRSFTPDDTADHG